jgi:galactokinase
MDQLASAVGAGGHALRIDCTTLDVRPIRVPDDVDVVVVDSGEPRALAASAYADRANECQAAQSAIGPLTKATVADVSRIGDPMVRRRARHVVTENQRVDEVAAALVAGDRPTLRAAMAASHASLRDDFEVSTPTLDALVESLVAIDGVIGARLTGAGFGGCVVALVTRGMVIERPERQWRVRPSGGAHL